MYVLTFTEVRNEAARPGVPAVIDGLRTVAARLQILDHAFSECVRSSASPMIFRYNSNVCL